MECKGINRDSAKFWHGVGERTPQIVSALILMQNRLMIFLVEVRVHMSPISDPAASRDSRWRAANAAPSDKKILGYMCCSRQTSL